MSAYEKFINASQNATSDNGLSIKYKLAFHLFNPNGLCAIKAKQDVEIQELVEAGTVPSGWFFAYGVLNYFYVDQLYALNKKKAPTNSELGAALRGLMYDIETAREKIDAVQQAAK